MKKSLAKGQIGWRRYITENGDSVTKPLFGTSGQGGHSAIREEDVRAWKLKNGWTEDDLKREAEENERMAREWAESEKRRKGKGRKAA